MKKILLFAFLCLGFCQSAKAEITIEDAFQMFKGKDLTKELAITSHARGIIDYASFTAAVVNQNTKQHECVNRPALIWLEFVFDEYKYGKISGKTPFFIVLSKLIYSVCFK